MSRSNRNQDDNVIDPFAGIVSKENLLLYKAIGGEFLCTFLFIFIVTATGAANGRAGVSSNLNVGVLSTAFASVALIYSFADVSGAHFNPAVTFATVVTNKTSWRKGMAYVGAQLGGAVMSQLFLLSVFPDSGTSTVVTEVLVLVPAGSSYTQAWFMEFTLTFILVYVIFAVAFDTVDSGEPHVDEDSADAATNPDKPRNLTIYTTSGLTKAGFAPISIGFTLGFLCAIGGSVSGGAFNPARVFGPALVSGQFDNQWLYWTADLCGAALAGFTQSIFFAHKPVQKAGKTK